MTAHDAAKEALNAALDAHLAERIAWHPPFGATSEEQWEIETEKRFVDDLNDGALVEGLLAALVRSEAVRAGVAASFHGFNSPGECECGFLTERNPEVMRQHQADVVLAALTPPEATE